MTKRTYQLFVAIGIGAAVLCLFFDYRYTIGLLCGMMAAYLSHLLLLWYTSDFLRNQSGSGVSYGFFALLRMIVQCLALLVYFLFPDYVKLLGVLIGLFLLKICIYIDDFLNRRKERQDGNPS